MSGTPLRVAFAGLAHSHPYTDAANVRALGAEVVGVHDADTAAAGEFAARFGGAAVASVEQLAVLRPDLVIATPRPHEIVPFLRALDSGRAPVFANKVIAATTAQLAELDRALAASSVPVGTSSVLRFAPALTALATSIRPVEFEVLALRVHAQHDNAAFRRRPSDAPVALSVAKTAAERQEVRREPGAGPSDRSWQDDPRQGGGTAVTVGVHAWEMIDVLLPGATLVSGSGWTRVRRGSNTVSEDAAGIEGLLRVPGAQREVPVQVLVTGTPGPDAYTLEVVTADGIRSLALDVDDANTELGFRGLIRALLDAAAQGATVASWTSARAVVANTIHAAEISRGQA
ncbi:hypothetical protein RN51_01069 [Microbacterium oxydans]|uniref:Gfo/Idh/MocA-like oxidoreductase N-terminal domain-containing protein n=1 Tax=Microbacterium oxydans TaxID=82380 RepID=A0A0F0KYW8_9MICO|nr:hypothetical protein [Microbacterium oxydans]KJL24471.1 hypothetical protein RN51_01069 [Microbacterium oxydans]